MGEEVPQVSNTVLTGKILIVDDEPDIRKTLQTFFERSGYLSDCAEDGLDAVQHLDRESYDLVITDLKMPGVDGRELLRIMSEKFSHVPRIVLTAIDSSDDILLALKTGADDFIQKPITDFSLLNHTIQKALERKKLSDDRIRTIVQMEKINEVISMLNRGLDTEEIFRLMDVSLKAVLPFNSMILFENDAEHGIVTVRLAASDLKISIQPGTSFPMSEGQYAEMGGRKDMYILRDAKSFLETHASFSGFRPLCEQGILSGILMELVFNDKHWGYLFFGSDSIDAFSDDHARFLRLIAGQLAFGIHRGELLSELELHSKHLEHLVKVRTYEVLKTQKTTIFALSRLAEKRDNETGDHLHRMRNYCILLAQLLKYAGRDDSISNQFLRDIYDSSILHDIGKVGIPDHILLKPGPLTPEEFEVIKTHTVIGYDSLKEPAEELGENSFLDMAKDIILYHHERWDGKGYPQRLEGNRIPLAARIVSIGDVYDALTSRRPYKEAMSHLEAVAVMENEAFKYDPVLFALFLENHGDFDRIRKQFM